MDSPHQILEPDLRSQTSQPGGAFHAFEVFADVGPVISRRARELCDWLAGVSPQQAQIVLLKDALGYSFEEIADAAGMPVGTAKCHAHRGRNRLREHLEDRDVA